MSQENVAEAAPGPEAGWQLAQNRAREVERLQAALQEREDARRDAVAIMVRALTLGDSADYGTALWRALTRLDEDAAELLEEDEEAARERYGPA